MHPEHQRANARVWLEGFALLIAPLTAGLAINYMIGWWSGLAALLAVALVGGCWIHSLGRQDHLR